MNRDNADGGGGIGGAIARVASIASSKSKTKKSPSRSRSSSSSRRSSSSSGSSRSYSRSSGSSSRRYSSSGGGSSRSSGGSSGGGGGGSYSAPKAKAPPSLASYLGTDSVYQQSLRGGKRSLADFISEIGRRRGEAQTQFTQTKGSMERDRTQQLGDLENEFASRGLIQSGLYGEEQGKFQQQYTEQRNALGQQQTSLLADLLSQQKNYQRENDLANEQARQEAIARRAAKYKIGA